MFFGIAMISLLLLVITNTFYKRTYGRAVNEERTGIMKLSVDFLVIEQEQSKYMDFINQFINHSSGTCRPSTRAVPVDI